MKEFTEQQTQQKTELEKQIKKLQDELQSKATQKAQNSVLAKIVQPAQASQGVGTGDDKMWIYMRESGNRTTARNSGGCLGLGQACPGSKLLAVCPDLNDYGCQDSFFTNYMIARYGTWSNAKAFWLKMGWW